MSLILFSEGSVKNAEEALLRAVPVVNLIEDLSLYLCEGEILGHDHQESHGERIYVSAGQPVRGVGADLTGPIVWGPRPFLDKGQVVLCMTKVNQGKFEVVRNNNIVRLDVAMSKIIVRMKIKDSLTRLPRKVSLKLRAELLPHSISVVVV